MITAANAIVLLSIAELFPTPIQIQQFAMDDVFSTQPLESAEVQMGVDGNMTAGFVFVPVRYDINLQADSPSAFFFDTWWTAQQAAKDIFPANGVVVLPAVGQKWALTKGVLISFPPIPDAGKVLKPRKFGITWESVLPALV